MTRRNVIPDREQIAPAICHIAETHLLDQAVALIGDCLETGRKARHVFPADRDFIGQFKMSLRASGVSPDLAMPHSTYAEFLVPGGCSSRLERLFG